ncbi:MAG: hypothetical protein WCI51_04765 [Lentisphaerota bacterium]
MKEIMTFVLLIMLTAGLPVFSEVAPASSPKPSEDVYRRYPKPPERWHDPFGVYWKEARPVDFVYLGPAQLGGGIFSFIGYTVMWPGKLIWNTCNWDFSDEDAFFPPIDFSSKYCGVAGCYVLGSPFWLLEKAFWDGPVWLFSGSSNTKQEPVTTGIPKA